MDFGARLKGIVRRKAVWGSGVVIVGAVLLLLASAGCGEMTREGTASSYLILDTLEAAPGAEPDEFGGNLLSDVLTVVDDIPGVYNDIGQVTVRLAMKDPLLSPSSANSITITRYHVEYRRTDGQNRPGIDVPFPFDGGLTMTVRGDAVTGSFEIVRHIAKQEAPLKALLINGVIISTIAEVTFYGRDQTGREVSVMGRIQIDFGNFADPS
jgi:hypothetical protein